MIDFWPRLTHPAAGSPAPGDESELVSRRFQVTDVTLVREPRWCSDTTPFVVRVTFRDGSVYADRWATPSNAAHALYQLGLPDDIPVTWLGSPARLTKDGIARSLVRMAA